MANRKLNRDIISSTQYNGTSSIGAVAGTWGGATWVSMTWMCWVKFNRPSTNDVLGAIISATDANFMHLQLNQNIGTNLAIYANTVSILISGPTQYQLMGDWHHLAVSTKSGATNIYLDGVLFSTATTAYANITQAAALKFGAGFGSARFSYINLTEVAVFAAADATGALTQTQIQQAMRDGPSTSVSSTLYSYWPHTDGQGTTITDTVGGRNVTLTSTSWSLDTPSKKRRAIRPLNSSLAFDGSTTYVSIPDGTILNHVTNITVGGWVWNHGRDISNILFSAYRAATNGWVFYVTGNQLYITKGALIDIASGVYLQPNTLYHLAVKLGASREPTFYVNGVKVSVSSNTTAINANSDAKLLGAGRSAAGAIQTFSKINMSDWRFIDAALSDAEVLDWYQNNTVHASTAGRWKLDEGTGTTATDSIGTIGNGTITAPVWSIDSPSGNTRKVTGVSLPTSTVYAGGANFIDLSASTLNTGIAFSVSFWVKATTLPVLGGILSKDVAGNNAFVVYQAGNILNIQMRGGTGNLDVIAGRIELNKWYHVAFTVDTSKNMKTYLDTNLVTKVTLPSQPSNLGTFRAGRGTDAFWGTFFGNLKGIHTFQSTLSHEEIIKDYNQQPVSNGVNSWAMTEGSGTTVADSIGGATGNLTSVTWSVDGPIY